MPCDLIVVFNKKRNITSDFGLINVKRDSEIIVEDGIKRVEKGVSFL